MADNPENCYVMTKSPLELGFCGYSFQQAAANRQNECTNNKIKKIRK